jgi:hypothetical protein
MFGGPAIAFAQVTKPSAASKDLPGDARRRRRSRHLPTA